MKIFVGLAAATLLLAGCGGAEDGSTLEPTTNPPATTAPSPTASGDVQATGDVDCSVFSRDQVATWAIWTQMFAQMRTVDQLATLAVMGYTPELMDQMLDDFEQLKGIDSGVYGTPDEALVVFRTANDTYAAIIAKGDAATDADFAPLDELKPTVEEWITAQASVTGALNQACPDL